MSSFRLICIAALTAAMSAFVVSAAAAQSAAAADQSGKSYLAGLRPPHEHQKALAKTTHVVPPHKAATTIAHPAAKRTVAANAKHHRPVRLADKINSHVSWPSVEPPAADEPTTPTVLQFATDDAAQDSVAPPRPAAPAAAAAIKITPPAKIAASEKHNTSDSGSTESPGTASTIVQTERFEAPASSQMRVILPAQSEPPATASIRKDSEPARSNSVTAQTLVTLAGAITACVVAWLMIGFGSGGAIRSRQT